MLVHDFLCVTCQYVFQWITVKITSLYMSHGFFICSKGGFSPLFLLLLFNHQTSMKLSRYHNEVKLQRGEGGGRWWWKPHFLLSEPELPLLKEKGRKMHWLQISSATALSQSYHPFCLWNCYFLLYNLTVPLRFLPWEIQVTFPEESQLRQSCYPTCSACSFCVSLVFSVSLIHQTLTWTTWSLMCVCHLFACVYTCGDLSL